MGERRFPWASPKRLIRRLVPAIVGPAAVTLLAIPDPHPHTSVVALLYVLAVVVSARLGGALAGVAASALSFLALNFFFTRPLHTVAVAAVEDLVALVVFLATSVLVGVLFSSAIEAKARAERRELEARLVNRLATRLLSGDPTDEVVSRFAGGLCDIFELGRCSITTSFGADADVIHSDTGDEPHQVPLQARDRAIGEMTIWPAPDRSLTADQIAAVADLATQLALALEGARLSIEVRRAELDAHASRLKAALFSGVTHDVKTPLASIMASVTSLIDGRDFSEESRRDHLDTIKEEAERLHRVVNNLLDVARLRAGALVAHKTPSAIDELMESVLNRLRPLLGNRSVEIRVTDDVPEIPMDVIQIDQVLTNLIENAIKFTPSGSAISLSAVGNRDGIRVTVSDEGPGIARGDRERIFEPFERGDGAGAGTGLGLAISHAIVSAHGGRMWVSDNPTGGAAFTFELPGIDEAAEEVSDGRTGARR
ncbi:MAG TPA: ATP-binding protein [Actinomycetota bacterium]|nr:ATP-binding protein [Actinomycetota bacterium]